MGRKKNTKKTVVDMAKKRSKKNKEFEQPKHKSIPVKPVPDMSRRILGTDSSGDFGILSNNASITKENIFVEDATPEQRQIKETGKEACKLLEEDGVLALVQSLVTFRRGYTIAYRELQELLDNKRKSLEEKGESFNNFIEDFLIQYSMYEASKAFNEHNFMRELVRSVMPCIATIVDKHSKEEDKAFAEERINIDTERRVRKIPLGFKFDIFQEDDCFAKDRSLVLVGWYNALYWLVDNIVNTITSNGENRYTVVRFMSQAPKAKDQQSNVIRIGPNQWKGCADSQKKLAVCMGTYVADKISAQPDLLIVDNLADAYTLGIIGRPSAANAGDAHKQLRRWCNDAGCALICLIPFEEQDYECDISEPQWEQLRTFTYLRLVVTPEINDKYNLIVGHNASAFKLDKTILDNYSRGNIITVGNELT